MQIFNKIHQLLTGFLPGIAGQPPGTENATRAPIEVVSLEGESINHDGLARAHILHGIKRVEAACQLTHEQIDQVRSGMLRSAKGILSSHSIAEIKSALDTPGSLLVFADGPDDRMHGFYLMFTGPKYAEEDAPTIARLKEVIDPKTGRPYITEGERYGFANIACISQSVKTVSESGGKSVSSSALYDELHAVMVREMLERGIDKVFAVCRLNPVPNESIEAHFARGWERIGGKDGPIIQERHHCAATGKEEDYQFCLLVLHLDRPEQLAKAANIGQFPYLDAAPLPASAPTNSSPDTKRES